MTDQTTWVVITKKEHTKSNRFIYMLESFDGLLFSTRAAPEDVNLDVGTKLRLCGPERWTDDNGTVLIFQPAKATRSHGEAEKQFNDLLDDEFRFS